jgi:acyl-CoA hydrolase
VIDPFAPVRRRRAASSGGTHDLAPRRAADSRTVIVEVMEIAHANNAGNVHGGTIMRLADTAAGIAAARHSRRRVVTASMDEMSFLAPVDIGDMVHVQATVNEVFRSSMEVGVRIDVEAIPDGERRHVATAYLTFVAVDEDMKPISVPPIIAESDEEKRRQAHARIRREQRLLRKQALLRHQGAESQTSG